MRRKPSRCAARSALRGWRRRPARADRPISSVAKQTERPVRAAQRAARHRDGAAARAKSLVHGHVRVGSRRAARCAAIGPCLKAALLRCDETQTRSASEANHAISALALFDVARITDRRGAAEEFGRGRQPTVRFGRNGLAAERRRSLAPISAAAPRLPDAFRPVFRAAATRRQKAAAPDQQEDEEGRKRRGLWRSIIARPGQAQIVAGRKPASRRMARKP